MFEIRDGVMISDEGDHLDDIGLLIMVSHHNYNDVWFACRNDKQRHNWQISSRTNHRDCLYFIDGKKANHEELIDVLRNEWPEDLMWLLFHPEIYDGRYDGS